MSMPNYSLWDKIQRRIAEIQKEKKCSEDEAIIEFNKEQQRESEEKWNNYMKEREKINPKEMDKLEKLARRFGR